MVTEPTWVQVVPSADVYAVNVLPLRCGPGPGIRERVRAAADVGVEPGLQVHPVAGCDRQQRFRGARGRGLLDDDAGLRPGSVFSCAVTRAVMVPSPLSGWVTYCSWSAEPQMSPPEPLTVNVPLAAA